MPVLGDMTASSTAAHMISQPHCRTMAMRSAGHACGLCGPKLACQYSTRRMSCRQKAVKTVFLSFCSHIQHTCPRMMQF